MNGVRLLLRHSLVLLSVVVAVFLHRTAAAECEQGNILAQAEIVENKGVKDPKVVTDGWTAPDGTRTFAREAALFDGAEARITWELNAPTRIVALDIQADHDDSYVILGSSDGAKFRTLWEVPAASETGLQARRIRGLGDEVRFVRIVARGGDKSYAVAELQAFCRAPAEWPVPRLVRLTRLEHAESTATYQAFSGKIVVALTGLFLIFVVAPRLRRRLRNAVLLFVIGLSALGWTHFGQFQGKTMIHTWDMFHYYVGSKYYEELGYTELYRCIAKLERERGNGERYRGILIRNLDDNLIYPFWWTESAAGRCRANFSKEAWKSFGQDIDAFRSRMVSPPFEHVVGDHGFNATPFHATWLGVITGLTSPSERTLRVLAQIDSMALLAAVLSLAWGFGLPVAAVAALLIQVGAPWSYNWVGGGLGRHVWFAFACLGVALLRQRSFGRGTAALTAATLLRLFPIVFLGGLGVYFLSECIRSRRLVPEARRALFGFSGAVGIGLAVVLTVHGSKPLGDFVDDVTAHADAPSVNRMGFPHLLTLGPGKMTADLADSRLTDPAQPWREAMSITRKERKPLWYLAVVASLGVLGWVTWRVRSPWVSALGAGPLLYSLQEMTSYDYMWLVLLVPAAVRRPRAFKWLVAFTIFSQVVEIAFPDVELRHWICEMALFPAMVVFALELVEWGKFKKGGSPPRSARDAAAEEGVVQDVL